MKANPAQGHAGVPVPATPEGKTPLERIRLLSAQLVGRPLPEGLAPPK